MCDTSADPFLGSRYSPIGFVHLDRGSLEVPELDLGGSNAMAANFHRSYSSPDTRTTLLGPGWTDDVDVRLRGDPANHDLLFTLPNGHVERFKDGRDHDRTTGTNVRSRLLIKKGDLWIATADASTWTFNSSGSLIRVDNGTGDWASIEYSGGYPSETSGPNGDGLRFEIGGPGGRLLRVSDRADPTRFVSYKFDDAGRLIRAASSRYGVHRYAYVGDSQRLATVSDDGGRVLLSVEYDDQDRVVREQDAQGLLDGKAVSFVYEDLPDGGIRTTVTYPGSLIEPGWNPVQITVHDSQGDILEEQLKPTSTVTLIGRYRYDSENNQIPLDPPCQTTAATEPSPAIPPPTEPVGGIAGALIGVIQLFVLIVLRFFGVFL